MSVSLSRKKQIIPGNGIPIIRKRHGIYVCMKKKILAEFRKQKMEEIDRCIHGKKEKFICRNLLSDWA